MVNWAITTGLYGNWSSAIPSLKRADVWSSDRQVMVATPPWSNEGRALNEGRQSKVLICQ